MTALAIIHKQTICDQLAQGMRLSEIASLLGITPAAISQQLVNDPDYTTAQVLFVEARMDKRESEMESAPDQLNVTRARELLLHSRWLAERLAPDKYGKDSQQVVNIAPVFNVIVSNPTPTYTYDSATDQTQGGLSVQGQG